ncbi:lasso RiPP family leader peptide-containing protein [Hassallia byssoidea VB512170]|uniref:Lasso RiPP family leader peptide-containing protein n=1 Tax=Hassallia byssoidea VB512170 TaxID=1304833 RepID=A0A846HHX2_9CYAN|nr:lasso RiPP family leader peptide-containing protein [Hassalia byssoidea]NEU76653.1 lasso RiPP family leader peptide-containing protein [Hassalia byssoidea VB512170]
MKKSYEAPQLVKHGSVSNITAYSFDSKDGDVFYGQTNATNQNGTGSLNACITYKTGPKKGDCVNPSAKGV